MIEVIPEVVEVNGRRVVKVTVRDSERGNAVLDADTVNPLNAAQRRRVALRLAERAGDVHSAERIEAALLQCVDVITKQDEAEAAAAAAGPDGEPQPATERNVRLVRPELFITPEVVALSVPEMIIKAGQAVGRWRLYLRYSEDQKREGKELPQRIDLNDGGRLWVHPHPPPPAVPVVAPWSAESRERWLEGREHADGRAVFLALCAAFEDYLDLGQAEDRGKKIEDSGPGGRTATDTELVPLPAHPVTATLALWTMLTYCFCAWDAVPYLFVSGPAGSGKTRVFELLSRLAHRPIVSSNLSASALFRTLHERGGTLLLDEAERLTEGSPEVAELRSILLAGYKKGGKATRLESTGQEGCGYQMAEFSVYGPKAIACINGLPAPLLSRCIPVQMFRSAPDSPKPRRRLDEDPTRWQKLRDWLHVLALDAMCPAAPSLALLSDAAEGSGLSGRHYELWQPLLALAEWVDADGAMRLGERLRTYARELVTSTAESQVPDEDQTLLRVLAQAVLTNRALTPAEVLHRAQVADKETFARWSPRRVSDALRKYGIKATKTDGRRAYAHVTPEQMKTIERNYGIDLNAEGKERFMCVEVRSY